MKLSSASHGVKLRQSDDASIMLNTIPLLSPTMELDLFKAPWPSIDSLEYPNTQKKTRTEEENSIHSIWEENYQDLSGWCIDTFQGRCAFPIGEFEESKYSGELKKL